MDPILLILRPQPGAQATAARAAELGLEPVVSPLFEVKCQAWDVPEPRDVQAILLTSANAARCAGLKAAPFVGLPCFAVGEATAVAAREVGFSDVTIGNSDGRAALDLVASRGIKRILHLCGRDYMPLEHRNMRIERGIVYVSEAIHSLPPEAEAALRSGAVAAIHSPRAGAQLAKLMSGAGIAKTQTAIAAISAAAAEAAGFGWRRVEIAARPRDDALLELAAKLCKTDPSDTGNGA